MVSNYQSEDVLNALNAIKKLGINYTKKNTYIIQGYGLTVMILEKKPLSMLVIQEH